MALSHCCLVEKPELWKRIGGLMSAVLGASCGPRRASVLTICRLAREGECVEREREGRERKGEKGELDNSRESDAMQSHSVVRRKDEK